MAKIDIGNPSARPRNTYSSGASPPSMSAAGSESREQSVMMDMLSDPPQTPRGVEVDLFFHMLICGEGGGTTWRKRCTHEEKGQQSAGGFMIF